MSKKKVFLADQETETDEDIPGDELPPSTMELEHELCVLGCTGKILCMCDKDEENFMVSALTT